MEDAGCTFSDRGSDYYRHSLPVRVMHWVNVVVAAILLMSGLGIFNAHPALYWGRSSYQGAPPFLELGSAVDAKGNLIGITRMGRHEFTTTGFLGGFLHSDGGFTDRGFPSWLTIPSGQWLAMARRWHLFFAWLLVANGLSFLGYSLASGHFRRDLLPTAGDWRSFGPTVIDHLFFRHRATGSYNVLQKLAYLGVIFLILPLIIVNGLGMSPALDTFPSGWVDLFGGRQSMRSIHFFAAWTLVCFVLIHVFQVVVTGFWNNLRSMITGHYRIATEADHEKE